MCGISGYINLNGDKASVEEISCITDPIQHRGPDGFGYYTHQQLALGHRRLAILDLSEAGHQPMKWHDQYVIVFNGEIYNYIEIKEELLKLGYHFKSHSDTEVILAAYDCWKEKCVERFNGMWSFAIHDVRENKLFCSRDRFGVKPFYYIHTGRNFAFASEIKQLLHFLPGRNANPNVLMDYLVLGLEDHNEQTFFEGVLKLLPSHNLIYDLSKNTFSIQRYYSIKIHPEHEKLSLKDAQELYLQTLTSSIHLRLRSDVKVGTCLSGGLDSSSIAAIAAELNKNSGFKFSAFTAQSIDSERDETGFAKQVVDKSGLDWHVTTPKESDFYEVLDEVIRLQEEPFGSASIIMQYFVMQLSRNNNCIVLLDGQGGDETLLGYERYYPAYLMSLPAGRRIAEFFRTTKNSNLSLKQVLAYYYYFTKPGLRLKRQMNNYGFIHLNYLDRISKNTIHEMANSYKDIRAMQLMEITKTQLPHLLRYEDRNSMHHSIETRLPFLDFRLVELSLSLNNDYKIKEGWTKYLLRRAVENKLPSEVAWRKNKFGFEAPVRTWLRDESIFTNAIRNSSILNKISKGASDQIKDKKMLWKLYNIARWENLYQVELKS